MSSNILFFSLVILALSYVHLSTASTQRLIVTGKFLCGRQPSKGSETSVKLLDKNIGPDTVMGKMKVNDDGTFRIDGTSSGITTIDPELHIYTDCNDGIKPCQRRWKLKIPTKYVGDAQGYELGSYNMEATLVGEDRDCWH